MGIPGGRHIATVSARTRVFDIVVGLYTAFNFTVARRLR